MKTMSHSGTGQRLRGPRMKVNLGRAERTARVRPGTRKRVGHKLRPGHGFAAGWPGKRQVLTENGELGSNSLGGDRQGHGELGGPALHMIRRKAMGDAVRCRHATFSLLEVSLSPCLLTSAACTFSPLLPNVTVTVLRPLLATRLDNRGGFYTLPCHQPTPLLIPNPSSPRRPPGRMLARLALPRR